MASCRFVLLWLLLLGGLTAVADQPFVIESFPPKAEVWNADLQYLGLTGEQLSLKSGTYSLTLRLENHSDTSFTISGNDLKVGRYPPQGVVSLEPLSGFQAVKDQVRYRPLVVIFWLVILGGLPWLVKRTTLWRRRQRTLEAFVPQDGEQRSLILENIGKYRVVSPLGQGGMAEVYLAVPNDTLEMDSAVAIKVMNKDLRERSEFAERFEREIVVSQELAHPGIVEVLEWGWHRERLYLMMEYVEGRELRSLLPELKGDWLRIQDILSQLMLAVDYAHQRGVAHRDLKPENVMVTKTGRIKVMDFGLARAVDSKTLTLTGVTMGSPKYIAPESVAGESADERADQYSLGVMAYEMIVGRLPFEGDQALQLLYSHIRLEPEPPSKLAELPTGIDDLILRMLRKAPRERFRTVEEARMELLGALRELC